MKNTHISWRVGEQVYTLTLMNVLGVCTTIDYYQNNQLINASSIIGLQVNLPELKVSTSYLVNKNADSEQTFNFFVITKKGDSYYALAVDELISNETDNDFEAQMGNAVVLDSIYNQQVALNKDISVLNENNSNPVTHILLLEKNNQKFALKINEIEYLENMYDLKSIKIITEDICGYVEYRGCPVPVFNFEQDKKDEGQIVLFKVNQKVVGLAFSKIHNLVELPQLDANAREVSFENDKWPIIDSTEIFKKYDLELLCRSYQKLITIFDKNDTKNGMTNNDLSEDSSSESFLNFRLGYQFTLSLNFVKSVEIIPPDFNLESNYFNYHEKQIPFFDTRKIYGMPSIKTTSESRLLILEIEKSNYACLVDSVGDLIEIDKGKSIKFAEWALKDMPIKLKQDIEGHVYAINSHRDRAHTLIFINLNYLKNYILEAYKQNKIA